MYNTEYIYSKYYLNISGPYCLYLKKIFDHIIESENLFHKKWFTEYSLDKRLLGSILWIVNDDISELIDSICNSMEKHTFGISTKQNYFKEHENFPFFEVFEYKNKKLRVKLNIELARYILEPQFQSILFVPEMPEWFNTDYTHLYEIFRKCKHSLCFSLDEIREILVGDKNKYKKYSHLKSNFLIPAIEHLNSETDIFLTLKEIKEQKKVIRIEIWFNWNDKNNFDYWDESELTREYQKISLRMLSGIVWGIPL